jgi:exodeoxyribonuclease VII small subunit
MSKKESLKTNPSVSDKLDFEKSLAELEQLVNEMENGQLSLDESLAKFEKGVALTKACQNALKQAEQRVNLLLEKHGETLLEPFSDLDD